MENTKPTPVTNKGSNNKLLVLAALIALFIATLAYGYYQTKNSKSSPAISSSEWAEFKSEKYGFKFDYPKEWGSPRIVETKLEKGIRFAVILAQNTSSLNREIFLLMESEDAVKKVCEVENKCETIPPITNNSITQKLNDTKYKKVAEDAFSYATITNTTFSAKITKLDNYGIVDIGKSNISAAQVGYHIKESSGCPENKFSRELNCINQSHYATANTVLKSIKSL